MTSKALDVLAGNEKGFFLMVEGGKIDYAAHHNDAASVILETLAFDKAVQVAYEFQKKNPDTLLVITADHETGGLVILPNKPTGKGYEGKAPFTSILDLPYRIGWATGSHTANPLFLWGIGPGSEKIKGWRHNTEVFTIIREAYGF
jgi:alkaline phosphatase